MNSGPFVTISRTLSTNECPSIHMQVLQAGAQPFKRRVASTRWHNGTGAGICRMEATHGVYLLVVHILVIVAELCSDWTLALQQHTFCDALLPRPNESQNSQASDTGCFDKMIGFVQDQ